MGHRCPIGGGNRGECNCRGCIRCQVRRKWQICRSRTMGKSKTTKKECIDTLGTEPSDPLSSAPGSEPHQPTMSIMGGLGERSER